MMRYIAPAVAGLGPCFLDGFITLLAVQKVLVRKYVYSRNVMHGHHASPCVTEKRRCPCGMSSSRAEKKKKVMAMKCIKERGSSFMLFPI